MIGELLHGCLLPYPIGMCDVLNQARAGSFDAGSPSYPSGVRGRQFEHEKWQMALQISTAAATNTLFCD